MVNLRCGSPCDNYPGYTGYHTAVIVLSSSTQIHGSTECAGEVLASRLLNSFFFDLGVGVMITGPVTTATRDVWQVTPDGHFSIVDLTLGFRVFITYIFMATNH